MNTTEAQRLAAAINALRPDWPTKSLRTFIECELDRRSYRDAAVALAYIATDAATRTPKRVLEAGPWWAAGPSSEQPVRRLSSDATCDFCNRDEARCREARARTGQDDHDFVSVTEARRRAWAETEANVDRTTGELRAGPNEARDRALAEIRRTTSLRAPVPSEDTSPQGETA